MKHLQYKLAAAVTTGVMMSVPEAFANPNMSAVADNIVKSTGSFPKLISTVAYIGGVGLGVAGIFKLKQHVDNPGQHAMKDGLVRLGAGGGLLALPYITTAMLGSVGSTTDGAKFDAYSQINNSIPK